GGAYASEGEREVRQYVVPNLVRREDGRWGWRYDSLGIRGFIDAARTGASALWSALLGVQAPVMVVRGDRGMLSRETAERMVQGLPTARLAEVADSGHDVHIDQPEALLSLVLDFLGTADASAGDAQT